MWNTLMAVNSFMVWPLAFVFLMYTLGRAIMFLEWKLLVLGIVVFIIASFVEVVLGILSD
jgi:membrane protein DedA with SNARE-associated domain